MLPQISQDYLVKLIGIPYELMDCYQLAYRVYKDIFKINLDNLQYDQPINRTEIDGLFNLEKSKFKKVNNPNFGDIIVIRVLGLAAHIGVFLDGNNFIHTTSKTGCVVEDLRKYRKRIIGFYRWPSLDIA